MSLQYIADFDSAEAHRDEVVAVKWLPQGAILSASLDGTLRVWHSASGVALGDSVQVSKTRGGIISLAVNAAGDRALTTCLDESVALWDLSGVGQAVEEATKELKEHEQRRDEAMKQDSNGANGTEADAAALQEVTRVGESPVKLISRRDSVAGSTFQGTEHKSARASFSVLHPTKPIFASTGASAAIYLYSADPETFGEPIKVLTASALQEPVGGALPRHGVVLSFSPDGELIAVGTTRRQTLVFSVETGALLLTLADHAETIRVLSFSTTPSGASNHLYVGADDQIITIHDVLASASSSSTGASATPVGSTIGHLQGHSGWISGVEPAGDGRILGSCSTDGTVKLWDLATTPKSCVMTVSSEGGGSLWGLSWKPAERASEQEGRDGGTSVVAKMPRSTAFVTAGSDGKLRFYRSAGVAQS